MNHSRFTIPSAEGMSPEMIYVECPTCGTLCKIRFCLLLDDHKHMVHLTICDTCQDHLTIRAFIAITPTEWEFMWLSGVPVVHYEVNNG